jgi:hypothetical protein
MWRAGDAFFVNLEKGITSINVSEGNVTGLSSLTINTGTEQTYIDSSKIETGNFVLRDNTILTTTGPFNIVSADGEIYLNENILIDNTAQLNNHKSEFNFIKSINPFVEYTTNTLKNSSLTLSESQYKFKYATKDTKLITYNHNDRVLKKGDNRAFSMWFMTEKFDNNWEYTLLHNFDSLTNKGYKITLYNGTFNFQLNNNIYSLPINGNIEIKNEDKLESLKFSDSIQDFEKKIEVLELQFLILELNSLKFACNL